MSAYWKHKMKTKSPAHIAGMVILFIIGIAALITLFGFGTMYLWNWLMPELFDLPTITFWQTVGLLILAKIFFGGFEGGKKHKKHKKHHGNHSCGKGEKSHKKEYDKWKYYNEFWAEEGEAALEAYMEKKKARTSLPIQEEE